MGEKGRQKKVRGGNERKEERKKKKGEKQKKMLTIYLFILLHLQLLEQIWRDLVLASNVFPLATWLILLSMIFCSKI